MLIACRNAIFMNGSDVVEDNAENYVSFSMGGMIFEYDDNKNQKNIKKHGISFKNAARVFFDYDRIEYFDKENSQDEDRYNTIGDISAASRDVVIGNIGRYNYSTEDILFVVYTERIRKDTKGTETDITRLISARFATSFERGLYYGKF